MGIKMNAVEKNESDGNRDKVKVLYALFDE